MQLADIGPISEGHALVIPKYHGAKLDEIPDEHLTELLPVAKKIAIATGAEQYNVLQNNGRMAHQMVDHVHCKSRRLGLATEMIEMIRVLFLTLSCILSIRG